MPRLDRPHRRAHDRVEFCPDPTVDRLLATVRRRLEVDAVLLSLYHHDASMCVALSGDGDALGMHVGMAVEASRAPSTAVTAIAGGVAEDVTAYRELSLLSKEVGLHVGAAAAAGVHTSDGHLRGALLAASATPVDEFATDGLALLHRTADVVGALMEDVDYDGDRRNRQAVRQVIDRGGIDMVVQPIVSLDDGYTVGAEALARFPADGARSPDVWFALAARHGMGTDLEETAARAALRALPHLPDECYLAINASPQLVAEGRLEASLAGRDASRVVVEVTEHARVDDYGAVTVALDRLRERGARVAVDDVGAGFASMRHVLALQPDIIKIDGSLIRDIHIDPARQMLAQSLSAFASRVAVAVVAEAVETVDELEALRTLTVDAAQGHLFARPGPAGALRHGYPVGRS